MRIRKFNESTEWSTYNVTDAKNLLKDAFFDYINPTDGSSPAKIEIEIIGHNIMAFWTIKIPLNIKGNIHSISTKLNNILEDLKHKLRFLDDEFEGLYHEIKLEGIYLSVSLWVRQR